MIIVITWHFVYKLIYINLYKQVNRTSIIHYTRILITISILT